MKHIFKIIAVIAFLYSITLTVWILHKTPKIAVVRTGEVIQKFHGMKEVQNYLQQESQKRQWKLDTLYNIHKRAVDNYNADKSKMSSSEKMKAEQSIELYGNNYMRMKQQIENELQDESDKATQGALNQINSYVEKYAKEHDLKIVIGVTLTGNVMYAEKEIDITDDIIKGLNSEYK